MNEKTNSKNHYNKIIKCIDDEDGELFRNLTEEQVEILNSIWKVIPKNYFSSHSLDITLNFYHNFTKYEGLEFEIDAVFIIKKNNKYIIFCFEYKNYDLVLNKRKKSEEDLKKFEEKMNNFFNYTIKNNSHLDINFYSILFAKEKNEFCYKTKFHSNDRLVFIDNISFNKNLLEIFRNDEEKIESINYLFLENLIKKPRDCEFLKKCILGEMNFLEDSNEGKIMNIISDESKKIFIFDGEAGSGKTAVAFYLFSQFYRNYNDNVVALQIINKNFYRNEVTEILNNRANEDMFDCVKNNSEDFRNCILEKKSSFQKETKIFIFIDEAQRLREQDLKWLNDLYRKENNIYIFLFGDDFQTINNNDQGLKFFLKSYNNDLIHIKLSSNYRLSNEILNKIQNVFFIKENSNKCTQKYNIKIFENLESFMNDFKGNRNRKVMLTVEKTDQYDKMLSNYGMKFASNSDFFRYKFHNNINNYCFFPYDIISREIEEVYIYVPNFVKLIDKKIVCDLNLNINIIQQLNVLLTRATQKINIYISNDNYKKECIKKLEKYSF